MLLNDKVPFRMQWPQDTDLQVNGMKLNFTSTNLLISLLFLMFEISSCLEAFMRTPPPIKKKRKKTSFFPQQTLSEKPFLHLLLTLHLYAVVKYVL